MRNSLSAPDHRTPVAPIRVIGVGSPFGDDRAGWLVAEMVEKAIDADRGRIEVRSLDRPGFALLHAIAECEAVILIDAVAPMGYPGRIHRLRAADLDDGSRRLASGHGFGLVDALQLAAVLKRLPSSLRLYGIELGTVENPDRMSTEVQEAAVRVAAEIVGSFGLR
jgi:hydrogenase maturation protease